MVNFFGVFFCGQVSFSWRPPAILPAEVMFFTVGESEEILDSNIAEVVKFGVIRGNILESLLRSMHSVHVPVLMGNDSWPDSIKKDFASHLHRFMASLTETVHSLKVLTAQTGKVSVFSRIPACFKVDPLAVFLLPWQGSTVLYVPVDRLENLEETIRDKDLLQSLECVYLCSLSPPKDPPCPLRSTIAATTTNSA